jgi:N-acetylmuramoyl-L-alanine amidase
MPAVAGAGHGRVTALGLNVRSSPHAGSRGNIIGSLRRGDQVEIIGRDGAWLQITFQGQLAFVHSGYVEREAAKPATPDAEPGGPSQPLDGKPASFGPTQDATNIGDDIQR